MSASVSKTEAKAPQYNFLYVIVLLVVFILGYLMGEQNVFSATITSTEGRAAPVRAAASTTITKEPEQQRNNATNNEVTTNLRSPSSTDEHQPTNSEAAAAAAETIAPSSTVRSTTSSSMPYNISFDPIDCVTYPGSGRAFFHPMSYNSNYSQLQGSMYYISKPSTKIMTISDPTPMMEYVINATTSAAADELFVDIGGNIGLYTLSTLSLGIPTLSVEPIAYNLDRLCKGYRKNMEALVKPPPDAAQFTLIKAAVANEAKPEMNISHPVASFGKQDQSSLFANTIGVVRKPVLEVETVPLVRLDQVIPANIPIGFVKIDVQGAESLVLEGMRGLLERKTGFPKMVWYEEQARVVKKANIVKLGQNQAYLESFGYQCRTLVNDILCQKERA